MTFSCACCYRTYVGIQHYRSPTIPAGQAATHSTPLSSPLLANLMHSPSATLDIPFLFLATTQLPYPRPDLLASSAKYHAGCPSPSISSPSQPRVLLLLSRVAHHAAYCSAPWDQLENLTRELERSQNLGQQKTHSHVQAVGGFAEQLASSSATAEALQHGMHQVTELPPIRMRI